MASTEFDSTAHHAGIRVGASVILGVIAAVITGLASSWVLAPIAGWIVLAIVYLAWTWIAIGRLGPERTRTHATREDPTRFVSHVFLTAASIASLGAIAAILLESGHTKGILKAGLITLVLITIALSWLIVQTLFTLRYAHLYYRAVSGGISFNQKTPPQYSDFAYLAVTLGATFQVSDTNIEDHAIRITVLRHALLSYLFGVVILAATVNLISSLL